jgi:hypothetical protein
LPARRNNDDLVWRKPTYHTIYRIVANPIYGGAYAYGKSKITIEYDGAVGRRRTRVRPRDEWLALHPGAHEGYVDWERSEAIRRMVSDNIPTSKYHGATSRTT